MSGSDIDEFWDLTKLIPEKHRRTVVSYPDVSSVEIATGNKSDDENAIIIPPRVNKHSYRPKTISEYVPANPLIEKVTLQRWPTRFKYYESFTADAGRLFDKTHGECSAEEYFSYIPQYSQLNEKQMNFYLWWRECFRRGEYIECSPSYLYLFIYEVINLPGLVPAETGVKYLTDLWLAYREKEPSLDRRLAQWLCDYCLIHGLESPTEALAPILGAVLKQNCLREFYIVSDSKKLTYTEKIISASIYDWRAGKYYNSKTEPLYDKIMPAAIQYICTVIHDKYPCLETRATPKRIVRDSFCSALCSYDMKMRIDIDIASYKENDELCRLATGMVRCCDNHIRSLIGIKSRFPVKDTDDAILHAARDYFIKFKKPKVKKQPAPLEYDYLYESESSGISPEEAERLERESWKVTELLISDEMQEEEQPEEEKRENNEASIPKIIMEALGIIGGSDSDTFRTFARERSLVPEALCDMVNETLYDIVGDIVIENTDGQFSLIEEYREDVEKILRGESI